MSNQTLNSSASANVTLSTTQDCEDLLIGSTWLSAGGGGSVKAGMFQLQAILDEGLTMGWQPVDSVADDAWTATVGVHGVICPPSEEVVADLKSQGFDFGGTNEWVGEAVKGLSEHLGRDVESLVACELGPESIADVLTAGARLGIPVVDGDYIGRACPEELQATYCLYDKFKLLFASADPWGNVTVVKKAVSAEMLERYAKMLSVAAYGAVAVAAAPLKGEEMKAIVVRNTLSICMQVGQALRKANENNEDAIAAGLAVINGWRLFEGAVIEHHAADEGGYTFGKTKLKGTGEFAGQTLETWFQNEIHITWLNDKPWIFSPDIVSLVYKKDGFGPLNSEIELGDEIVAVGIKTLEEDFRSEKGLSLGGPRHYGFDIDYVAIEDVMASTT